MKKYPNYVYQGNIQYRSKEMKAVGILSAWCWYWKAPDRQGVSSLYLTSHSSVRLLFPDINDQINSSSGQHIYSFLPLSLHLYMMIKRAVVLLYLPNPKVKGLLAPWCVPGDLGSAASCCFPAVSVAWEPWNPWIEGVEVACLECHDS